MALYDTVNPLVPGSRRGDEIGISSAAYKVSSWISDLALAYTHSKMARKTRKELAKLSDRALEDIGLTRSDIVAGTYRGL